MDKLKSPKARKQLLFIGLGVVGLILVIVYVKNHQSSSTDSTGTGNAPTVSELANSWNDSSVWSGPSGQHNHRHEMFGGGSGSGGTSGTLPPFNTNQQKSPLSGIVGSGSSAAGVAGFSGGSVHAISGGSDGSVGARPAFTRPHGILQRPPRRPPNPGPPQKSPPRGKPFGGPIPPQKSPPRGGFIRPHGIYTK